jgi:hypothetical protein
LCNDEGGRLLCNDEGGRLLCNDEGGRLLCNDEGGRLLCKDGKLLSLQIEGSSRTFDNELRDLMVQVESYMQ